MNGDPLGNMDPDGRHPLLVAAGAVAISAGVGAINGGIGAWVQGGSFDDIAEGVYAGGVGGLLSAGNPVLGAMAGNALGQAMAIGRNGKPYSCFSLGSMLGAGIGGGLAAGLTAYPGGAFLGAQLDLALSTVGGIAGGSL